MASRPSLCDTSEPKDRVECSLGRGRQAARARAFCFFAGAGLTASGLSSLASVAGYVSAGLSFACLGAVGLNLYARYQREGSEVGPLQRVGRATRALISDLTHPRSFLDGMAHAGLGVGCAAGLVNGLVLLGF